jgi:hypothetical protein
MMLLRTTANKVLIGIFFLKMGNFRYKKSIFAYISNFKLTLVTKSTYNCSRDFGYSGFFKNALAD